MVKSTVDYQPIDTWRLIYHIVGNLQAQEKNYQEVLGIYCCDFSGEY